ncbi:MAG: hypothetical protein ISS50_07285 [Anaerolineae bacterium]|nr:hypothetical protein [Anaerolineae bacterium]
MIRIRPNKIIAIGFALVLFGFLAPFLMTIKVVEASYALSFLSYAASVSGLLLGIIGAAWYSRLGKR